MEEVMFKHNCLSSIPSTNFDLDENSRLKFIFDAGMGEEDS